MRFHPIKSIHLLILLFVALGAEAQRDTTLSDDPEIDPATIEYIENLIEDQEGEFDYNSVYDRLFDYQKNPLDLNKATEEDLSYLGLLTSPQIATLIRYRELAGDLLSIYELQAVPRFDIATINRILPYVKVGGGESLQTFNVPALKMLYQGSNELYLRWSRVLEEAVGFSPPEDSLDNRFKGDPNKYYIRFKHSYENRHSWGITMEKDAGEDFFTGSNKQGFDFYSFHIYYRNLSDRFKAIALGDFEVNFGQGLLLASGFSTRKGSFATNVKRGGRVLKGYTSVNEANFFRGGGIQLGLTPNLDFSAFASYRSRDANVTQTDTLLDAEEIVFFSSLQESGLHRTDAEIEDENAIKQFTTGGSLKWKSGQNHFAVNGVYTSFDSELNRTIQPYNQFFFNSGKLLNFSADYSLLWRNLNFFGETAYSDNGGIATIDGLLIGLDRKIDLAVVFRHFSKDFQSLYGNPFAETSSVNNETGLYFGLDINPSYNWQISAYFDTFQHPWLRFRTDAPSRGNEFLVQVKYRVKRTMEAYIRYRDERKQLNSPNNESNVDFLGNNRKRNLRVHVSNKVSKALELRNRVEFVFFDDGVNDRSNGFMAFQDVIFKPIGFPLSFTGRFAIFNTDTYDSRVYAYENDILYSFSIPAYAYRGMRYYLNLRYKGIRNMTMELRFAQSYVNNRDGFGSSLDYIEGPTKTEVKAQVKYKF